MRTFFIKNWHILILVGILILAGFFRLWQLDSIPPGLYSDEAVNALDAIHTMETGEYRVFYQDNNGREGLYIWLVALVFKFFGIGIVQFRIVGAVIGIATVAVVYFFTRELFDEKNKAKIVALASSFFIASSFWHINFSRIGFRAILLPFILTLSLLFLTRAMKDKRILNFIIAGVTIGLGFYTYTSFRMAVLILGAVFVFEFLRYLVNKRPKLLGRNNFKQWYLRDGWWKWNALGAVIILVALPLMFYFLASPENFSSRASGVFIFSKENPAKEFLISNVKTLGMFHIKGDMNWRHNLAGSPQLFLPVGILFLFGFFISLKELLVSIWRNIKKRGQISFLHTSYFILHTSFWIMLLPATLTWEGIPHSLRSIGVVPVVYIFAGLGFFVLYEWFRKFAARKKFNRITLWALGVVFLLAAAFLPFDSYRSWGEKPEVRAAFSKKLVDIGNYLIGVYPGTANNSGYTAYVVDEEGPWEPGNSIAIRPIQFITHNKIEPAYIFYNDVGKLNVKEDQQILVIPIHTDAEIYRHLLGEYGERLELTVYNKFIVIRINPVPL